MNSIIQQINFRIESYKLDFNFDAGTSRGVLRQKTSYFLKAFTANHPGIVGWGEAAPLPNLSIDDIPDFEGQMTGICQRLSGSDIAMDQEALSEWIREQIPPSLPSVRFAFETALLDLFNGGFRKIYETDFFNNNKTIPINGLIWMGNKKFMLDQIDRKLEQGFNCIKLKIGALDFEQECDLLTYIRKTYKNEEITLRVDANGAFSPDEALKKLEILSKFDLHSIEQPIRQGQVNEMATLCQNSPLPIALDEELIGIDRLNDKINLLKTIQPAFIILKPSLIGGMNSAREWISIAEEMKIGWWLTSALESNIGLNAISQFASTFSITMPQGLGTGQLYKNNIDSPLYIQKGRIGYNNNKAWADTKKSNPDLNQSCF